MEILHSARPIAHPTPSSGACRTQRHIGRGELPELACFRFHLQQGAAARTLCTTRAWQITTKLTTKPRFVHGTLAKRPPVSNMTNF